MKRFLFLLFIASSCTSTTTTHIEGEPDKEALLGQVQLLAENLIEPDSLVLNDLVHEKLTYGHSTGTIEDKRTFINALYEGVDVLTWEMSNLRSEYIGSSAWVRHDLAADLIAEGDTTSIALKVLLVWTYQDGNWQLIARQAVK